MPHAQDLDESFPALLVALFLSSERFGVSQR
jgi:hypothetical protein